jgi:hypothetical protein
MPEDTPELRLASEPQTAERGFAFVLFVGLSLARVERLLPDLSAAT